MRACSEAAEPACSMHVSTSTALPQRAGLHCRRMHASTPLLRFCRSAARTFRSKSGRDIQV